MEPDTSEPRRQKSPRSPSMGLAAAIEKLRALYEREGRGPIDKGVASQAMGYAPNCGPALRTTATLGLYGLIERQGTKNVRITALGMSILKPMSDEEKIEAIQSAAREPEIFRELMDRYHEGLPSDDGMVAYLIRRPKNPFNEANAKGLAKSLRETLALAQLDGSGDAGGEDRSSGDAFTQGGGGNDVLRDPIGNGRTPKKPELPRSGPDMTTDILTLDVGAVTLQCPSDLSVNDYQDLEDWIGIQLRRIKRRIKVKDESPNGVQGVQTNKQPPAA